MGRHCRTTTFGQLHASRIRRASCKTPLHNAKKEKNFHLRVTRSCQGPATEQSVQLPFEVPTDQGYASDHTHHFQPCLSGALESMRSPFELSV